MDETKIEALRAKYGKVGVLAYSGHEIVFRRPSRTDAREYRRKLNEPLEKPDALEQLAQVMVVAFDGEEDVIRARTNFTGSFLEEFPLAVSNPKIAGLIGALAGLVEEEDEKDLGKGVTVRSAPRSTSPTA